MHVGIKWLSLYIDIIFDFVELWIWVTLITQRIQIQDLSNSTRAQKLVSMKKPAAILN